MQQTLHKENKLNQADLLHKKHILIFEYKLISLIILTILKNKEVCTEKILVFQIHFCIFIMKVHFLILWE